MSKPGEHSRATLTGHFRGRRHGLATERKPEPQSRESATRRRLEDIVEARRLARELADY